MRDPDKWYDSVRETIYASSTGPIRLATALIPAVRGLPGFVKELIWDGTFDGRFAERDFAIEVYERHRREVVAAVPADRLLVYEVGDGWAPLCEFLGVEPPADTPFPHVNDRAQMAARQRAALGVTAAIAGAAVVASAGALLAARKAVRRNRR